MASCNLKFPIEAFNKEKKSQLLLVDKIYFDNVARDFLVHYGIRVFLTT